MREIDRKTIDELGISSLVLMENAGLGLVDEIERRTGDDRLRVTVVCGPGNNGGDGMVAARHLADRGHEVITFLAVPRSAFSGDAKVQLRTLTRLNLDVAVLSSPSSYERAFRRASESDVVVDSLFGTGLARAVEGRWAECVRIINSCPGLVVSADVPSGLDARTGHTLGECVTADVTVTFGFPKTGLVLYPGAQFAGEVAVADIGIPPSIIENMHLPGELLGPDPVRAAYAERWPDTHKGTYGHLLLCCGSSGKLGAGILASRGALRAGAGLVTLCVPASASYVVDAATAEVMTAPLPETAEGSFSKLGVKALEKLIRGRDALAIGPGLSTDSEVRELVRTVLKWQGFPAVVDADALNVLEGEPEMLRPRGTDTVLTPHPGEMARLLRSSTRDVQSDRIGAAVECSARCGGVVVLKGAGTVIAQPDGTYFINTTGNPGMASGGTGDVLTGIIGALLAMGHKPLQSALAGVYLHGASGDTAAEAVTEHALTATDIVNSLGPTLKMLITE
jgi:NAD(P)H-hydrate epimerase